MTHCFRRHETTKLNSDRIDPHPLDIIDKFFLKIPIKCATIHIKLESYELEGKPDVPGFKTLVHKKMSWNATRETHNRECLTTDLFCEVILEVHTVSVL